MSSVTGGHCVCVKQRWEHSNLLKSIDSYNFREVKWGLRKQSQINILIQKQRQQGLHLH